MKTMEKKKRKKNCKGNWKRNIALQLALVLCISSINASTANAAQENSTMNENAEGKDYTIEYTVDSAWAGAFNASVKITNNTDVPVEDWKLSFNFTGA